MKIQKLILTALVAIGLFATVIVGCKKDDEATSITLSSLKAGSIDLNGAAGATGVPLDASIIATFSTTVDGATANSTTITLVRQYDAANIDLTITSSGSTVTITPNDPLGEGTLYTLSIGGIKSSNGLAFTPITRTFTSLGAFAPSGAVAAWNFDDNANDIISGAYNAISVTGVTYVTGRNATAGKAASFDGSTSLIQIPNGATLENSSDFSLSFWILGDTLGHTNAGGGLKGNFVMGAGFFRGFEIECGGKFDWVKLGASYAVTGQATPTVTNDFFVNADGMDGANGGFVGIAYEQNLASVGGFTGLLQGKWAHIVITYEGAAKLRKMYVNGTLTETDDLSLFGPPMSDATGLEFEPGATDLGPNFVFGFAADPASTFWADTDFGNYANPDANHFKGMLDDVKIYHQVLTDVEISSMYDSGK